MVTNSGADGNAFSSASTARSRTLALGKASEDEAKAKAAQVDRLLMWLKQPLIEPYSGTGFRFVR